MHTYSEVIHPQDMGPITASSLWSFTEHDPSLRGGLTLLDAWQVDTPLFRLK